MKKIISIISILTLALIMTACDNSKKAIDVGDAVEVDGITTPQGENHVIKIGVTPVPHAQIVNDVVKEKLEKAGWIVEVIEFNDYVQPNTNLSDGQIDANYFQTVRYLEEQNRERNLGLVEIAGVHLEPMGLYSKNLDNVLDLEDGASISIPNDGSNLSRALKLLADHALIELEQTDDLYTVQNIVDNPRNLNIIELDAANLTRSLDDVDASVINGNYALQAELNPQEDALLAESPDSDEAYKYINYLVVKQGNENTNKTKALKEALQSEQVRNYIQETYSGSVLVAF